MFPLRHHLLLLLPLGISRWLFFVGECLCKDVPLSLLSQARLTIRKSLLNRLHLVEQLDLGKKLTDILLYRSFSPTDFDLNDPKEVKMYKSLIETCSSIKVEKQNERAVVWRQRLHSTIDMAIKELSQPSPKAEENPSPIAENVSGSTSAGAVGPPAPPPPARPAPPRPRLLRFEYADAMKA